MKSLKQLYSTIFKYKWTFLASIVFISLGQIFLNLSTLVLKDIFNLVYLDNFSINLIIYPTVMMLLYKLINMFLTAIGMYLNDSYASRALVDTRVRIIKHLHDLDFSFHVKKQSGSLISTIKRGESAYWAIDFELNRGTIQLIVDYIFVLYLFFSINLNLAFIIIIFVIVNAILTKYLISKNIVARVNFNEDEDKISAINVDNLINFETVKLFAKESWEQDRLIREHANWFKSFKQYAVSFRVIDISTGLLGIVGYAVTIFYSIELLSKSIINLGEFAVIIAFITSFFPKLSWFLYQIRNIMKLITDLEKYLNILDNKVDVIEKDNPIKLNEVKGEIEFKDITFSYDGQNKVFDSFNLKINAGESVAFVGYSGVGKTTLTKLLLRYYDIQSGKILLDGIDIKDVSKAELRSNIGVVPQEPILFNNSIAYNITYPKPNTNINQLQKIAKQAYLMNFIDTLPEKFNTQVGERGIKLSGGQKQRLAIARMLLADPRIIVFDEATSQLDSESERAIQNSFWNMANGKTTLIIAHRLSTVMRADRIIVLDKGKILQDGSHEELLRQEDGLYYRLWKLQNLGELIN